MDIYLYINKTRHHRRTTGGKFPRLIFSGWEVLPPLRFGHPDIIKRKNEKLYLEGGKNRALDGEKSLTGGGILFLRPCSP